MSLRKPRARSQNVENVVHVRGQRDYEGLSEIERENRHRAYDAVTSGMRDRGLSLSAAAADAGTTPAIVKRYASELLVKDGGRYSATPSDRSYQRMSVLSVDGVADVDTRGSRVRSLIGRHWNAIRLYGAIGDVSVLTPFRGKRAGGVELASDPDQIEQYLLQGELDVDDIYV
jgi:hypothetical protein